VAGPDSNRASDIELRLRAGSMSDPRFDGAARRAARRGARRRGARRRGARRRGARRRGARRRGAARATRRRRSASGTGS